MKALRTSGERQVDVLDLPMPTPEPGEVVIQMKSTGICGSDLHPYRHPTPLAPRPRLHLRPRAVRRHRRDRPGRHRLGGRRAGRAVLPPDLRRVRLLPGRPPQRLRQPAGLVRAPGAGRLPHRVHARRGRLPDALPEHLSFLDGAILSCQGGTAYAPLTRLGVSGRDVLVVSGLGPVGLLSVIFAKPMGATIVGIDPSAGRRALAEKLGAAVTLDPTAGDVGEQLRAHFPDGADKLTETSGATPAHQAIGELLQAARDGRDRRARQPDLPDADVPPGDARADRLRIEHLPERPVRRDGRVHQAARRQARLDRQPPASRWRKAPKRSGSRPTRTPARSASPSTDVSPTAVARGAIIAA